jgi:hypothetical protein
MTTHVKLTEKDRVSLIPPPHVRKLGDNAKCVWRDHVNQYVRRSFDYVILP